MTRRWTEEEMDRVAADLVDHAIIAAGGDLKRAEHVLGRVLRHHGKKRSRRPMLWVWTARR